MGGDLTSAPLAPVGPDDHVRGDRAQALILVADLTCPRCVQAYAALRDRPLAFRHFALQTKDPRAEPLARAAEAAARQGAFWPFVDALMADPGRRDDPHLWAHAERLGMDVARFDSDRRGESCARRVLGQTREAMRAGVVATPALFGPDCSPLDWRAIG